MKGSVISSSEPEYIRVLCLVSQPILLVYFISPIVRSCMLEVNDRRNDPA